MHRLSDHRRHRYLRSSWDSLIVASAVLGQAAHCALVVALKYAPVEPEFAVARQHLERATKPINNLVVVFRRC